MQAPVKTKKKVKKTEITKLRVSTWNVGTQNLKINKLKFVRLWRGDICGVKEHRWLGCLEFNQACIFKGKDSEFKFFYSAQESTQGGASILLAECWADKVIKVHHISDRILLLKLIIGNAFFTLLSVYAPQANYPGVGGAVRFLVVGTIGSEERPP